MTETTEPARVPGSRKDRARGLVQRWLGRPPGAFVATFVYTCLGVLLTVLLANGAAADRPTDNRYPQVGPLLLGLALLILVPVISGIVLGYRKSGSHVVAGYAGTALASLAMLVIPAFVLPGAEGEPGDIAALALLALAPAIPYFPAALVGAALAKRTSRPAGSEGGTVPGPREYGG